MDSCSIYEEIPRGALRGIPELFSWGMTGKIPGGIFAEISGIPR